MSPARHEDGGFRPAGAAGKICAKLTAYRTWLARSHGENCRRINRNGVIYFALKRFALLNPWSSPFGRGLCFVRASDSDPIGVFFTEGGLPTDAEVEEALLAYRFEFGEPNGGLFVLPATFWPGCYERTESNIDALRSIGALLPHEKDKVC